MKWPPCQVPAAQAGGGSVVAWGHRSCSGSGCVPKERGQLTNLNFLNVQVIPSLDFFSPLMTLEYSKMTVRTGSRCERVVHGL